MDQSLPQSPLGERDRSPSTAGAGERAISAEATPVRSNARRVQLGAVASDREILMLGRRAFERGDDAAARFETMARRCREIMIWTHEAAPPNTQTKKKNSKTM